MDRPIRPRYRDRLLEPAGRPDRGLGRRKQLARIVRDPKERDLLASELVGDSACRPIRAVKPGQRPQAHDFRGYMPYPP